jgi:hypothetical protein
MACESKVRREHHSNWKEKVCSVATLRTSEPIIRQASAILKQGSDLETASNFLSIGAVGSRTKVVVVFPADIIRISVKTLDWQQGFSRGANARLDSTYQDSKPFDCTEYFTLWISHVSV